MWTILTGMIPSRYLMVGLGILLAFGLVYLYGYHKGSESQNERLQKATEKLLEAEQALAKLSLKQATEDARRLSQEASRGSTVKEEYKDVKPSEVDPVDCISNDQRMFIRDLGAANPPG